jgi:hypothetical protein
MIRCGAAYLRPLIYLKERPFQSLLLRPCSFYPAKFAAVAYPSDVQIRRFNRKRQGGKFIEITRKLIGTEDARE